MPDTPTKAQDGFQIQVSPDRMKVTLAVAAGAEVSTSSIIAELREMKLVGFDDGVLIEAMERRNGAALSIDVAVGTVPTDERPERIEYRVPVADGISQTIARVDAGQLVAMITPAIGGTDGKDVFGAPIPHQRGREPVKIGRNLEVDKAGITAVSRGNLRLNANILSVEPLLEIRDDNKPIPAVFDGDAVIKGSLNEGRTFQLTGSLTIGGAIEAVQLTTGASVHAKGGIVGKQKGRLQIGGNLFCRFISGGVVIVAGDMLVQTEITHSQIACGGRLSVAHGPIFGGLVAANGGISCDVLGHPNGTATIIEVGDSLTCRSLFASTADKIEWNRKRIRDVRAKIAPLIQVMKQLTAQQRERATELLYEADELEAATEKMEEDLKVQTSRLSSIALAEVSVSGVAHPGVTVRLAGLQTTFTCALKGPFTIAASRTGTATEVVLIDGTDHSRTVLPSCSIDLVEASRSSQSMTSKAA